MAARQHRRAWEHERVELRAARVARTLCEFPLVSVLCLCRCVITVVVIAHLFCVRDVECDASACLSGTSLP